MSELLSFIVRYNGKFIRAYEESEVNEAIAELEESHKMEVEQLLIEIVELKEKRDTAEKLLNKALDCVTNGKNHIMSLARKNNHANYKRCLAMAEQCHILMTYGPEETSDFYDKWTYIWQELAEEFKPSRAKETK